MCYEFEARPPELPADTVLPVFAGDAEVERWELRSADGTRFAAAFAASAAGGNAAVMILPDVRGLFRFYVELAERFSMAGVHAIAIDYFGRTAGVAPRDEHFNFMAHLPQTSPEQVQADVATARDALRRRTSATTFVTVGFCFGGAQSFLCSANPRLGLDAVVGFYGTLDPSRTGMPFAMPAPLKHVGEMRRPVLGLFGKEDKVIPAADIDAFDRGLADLGVEHELISYAGAPHSFFDRAFEEHAEASADAWRRVLDFVRRQPVAAAP